MDKFFGGKFEVDNLKLKKIYDFFSKNNIPSKALKKIKENLGNEKTLKKLIEEFFPNTSTKNIPFSTNDLIYFFKHYFSNKTLSTEELEKASGGTISEIGMLALGLADTISSVGLTSVPEAKSKTTTNLKENLKLKESKLNKYKKTSERKSLNLKDKVQKNNKEKVFIGNCELKEEPKFEISKKDLENNNFNNNTFKIYRVGDIEEERVLFFNEKQNGNKTLTIKDAPITIEGKYLPMGRATYSATAFLLDNGANVRFNDQNWEQIPENNGKKIIVYKDSEVHKKLISKKSENFRQQNL